ncbi:MAG: histidine kinase [Pseudomonadota bacterium]
MTAADFAPQQATVGPFITTDGRPRRAMNWMFGHKARMFWMLQSAGWVGFFAFHVLAVSSLVAGWSMLSVTYSLSMSLIGFLSTSIMLRPLFQFARRQQPLILLAIAIGGTLLVTVFMSAAKAETFGYIFGDAWMQSRVEQLGTNNYFLRLRPDLPPNLFLLLSWGGFYFGINYYLTLRDETERALQSARLADQAQLKMLRYQLNPHFLFNTLNAISTLVITDDRKDANEMLTKLSAFLRYSLDSDPLQKTTLAEEVRALQLYLDIETTRFGDRLKISKDIDERVLDARVPSLILQPAIENAIKYAIAKMEAGGEIIIVARAEGDMLKLQVCDNGPDAPENPDALLRRASTGVGLLNMKERLAHLYGSMQSFTLKRRDPDGMCVSLKIPLERRSQMNG